MTNLFSRFSQTALLCVAFAGLAVAVSWQAVGLIDAGDEVVTLAAAGVSAFAMLALFLRQRRQTRLIRRVIDVCDSAAAGDLEPRLIRIPPDGDVERLAVSVNHLLDMTDAFVREAGASLDYVSRGKYFRRIVTRGLPGRFKTSADAINRATSAMQAKTDDFRDLTAGFEETVGQVVSAVAEAATQMQDAAGNLRDTTTAGKEQAKQISEAATDTSDNVSAVAAATEQLMSSIGEISNHVATSTEIADRAVGEADNTNQIIEEMSGAAGQIGDIVSLINEIAEQTNLLALNATVEAARAGEAGRGFAVVASEVKNLAGQTSRATARIEAEIMAVQGATQSAVTTIGAIGDTIREMNRLTAIVRDAVSEQNTAASSIANNLKAAADKTGHVSQGAGDVSDAVESASGVAGNVLGAAEKLSQQSQRLDDEVSGYLEKARAI